MKITFLFQLTLTLLFSRLIAQPQQDLWETFSNNNGLSSNQIHAIIELNNGSLWVGTEAAADEFMDGHWRTHARFNAQIDIGVKDMIEASNGDLIIVNAAGAVRYANHVWQAIPGVGLGVMTVFESSDGALWFGTLRDGVIHIKGNNIIRYTKFNGLAGNWVDAICEDSEGNMWFGTRFNGVSLLKEGVFNTFTTTDGVAGHGVYKIIASEDGKLWFATNDGLSSFNNGVWTTFTKANTENGLASNLVWTIEELADGTLLFGTSQGVSSFNRQTWNRIINPEWPPWPYEPSITAIEETADGAIWFGTDENGLFRYEEKIWQTINEHHLASVVIHTFDGSLWFSQSRSGVIHLKKGQQTNYTTTDGLIDNSITAGMQSSDSALWFCSGKGVSRFKDDQWQSFTESDGLISESVNVIFEAKDGDIWFGTDSGATVLQNGSWTSFTQKDGLILNLISDITELPDSTIVFATFLGLSYYKNNKMSSVTLPFLSSLCYSEDGSLWIGTDGAGVYRILDDGYILYTVDDGLTDATIEKIFQASDGAIWFATEYGGLNRFSDEKWQTFNSDDGLAGNWVLDIAEDNEGNFWFATDAGLSRFRPDKIPPQTQITDGPAPATIVGTSTPLFSFAGKDFRTTNKQLRFSWAMADCSETIENLNWSPAGSITTIETNSTRDAVYTFYVRAIDSWGNFDPTPAERTFTIDITPPTTTFNSHKQGERVAGRVALIGNAFDDSPTHDFKSYSLQYAPGEDLNEVENWFADRMTISQSASEIRNDTLAIWNTEGLQNGDYILRLQAQDHLQHFSESYLQLHVVSGLDEINPRTGSLLSLNANQIQLFIPANAITRDAVLVSKSISPGQLIPLQHSETKFTGLSFELRFASGADQAELAKPVTMRISYPDVNNLNIIEDNLTIYRSDDGQQNWQHLGGTVDTEARTISVATKKLGVFALYEDLSSTGARALNSLNIQPRIFSARDAGFHSGADISFELGKTGDVTIKIYNTAGRLVNILAENRQMNRGMNVVNWRGRDAGGDVCPGGLYVVAIEANGKMETKTVVVK